MALLGSFVLRIGGQVSHPLPMGSQRLLVFLALRHRVVDRIAIAGKMWPDVTEERAGASLRSALSRMDTTTHEAIVTAAAGLSLDGSVTVDFHDAQALARRLLRSDVALVDADLGPAALSALSGDLLPDWYDEWVLTEVEDWRELRVNALEAMARLLTAAGHLPGAAGAACAAMRVAPFRESAHASLIRVHLAEGNQSEALRVFDRYRTLLSEELGLEPTAFLSDLVATIRKHGSAPSSSRGSAMFH